jgi:hypothetical protein
MYLDAYICKYLYIYINTYICIYVYTYVYIHICTFILPRSGTTIQAVTQHKAASRTFACRCLSTGKVALTRATAKNFIPYIDVYIYIYIYICIYVFIHTYMYIYIYIYIYTYIYIYICLRINTIRIPN